MDPGAQALECGERQPRPLLSRRVARVWSAASTGTSADPDGQIATYAWDFGDNTTGSTATPSKTYASAGTYNVKLTVTDNGGATNSITKPVTVAAGQSVSYVGTARSAAGAQTSKSVTVPAATNVDDTMVLVLTASGTWSSPGAGWTQVSTLNNVSIFSTMWVKRVTGADTGSNITVTTSAAAKASLTLGVYRGVSSANPVSAFARVGDAGGTTHTTPTVSASTGDVVASFWTDKSTAVANWTAPGSVTKRSDTYDSGTSGRYSVLYADSGSPVGAGTYGGLTATTDTASDKAIMWTVALNSGS